MPEPLGAVKTGVYGVTDIFTEQRKYDKDKSKFFVWRERGFAQMVQVLITAIPKVTVTDPEPKHFEDGYRPMKAPLTNATIATPSGSAPETVAITISQTDIDVANFTIGQVWENDSIYMSDVAGTTVTLTLTRGISAPNKSFKHELMMVSGISGQVVTFRRHVGVDTRVGTTQNPLTSHILYLHSIAATDGAGSPTSFSQSPVVVNNYIQTFKESYEITDIAQSTDIFGENEWQRKARNARRNFARQLERAFLAGHFYKFSDGGQNKWFMGGVEEWIPEDVEHRINFAAPPTTTLLNSKFKDVFLYGSTEKWGFCGYGALTKISNASADLIRINDKMSLNIGMEVKDFVTAAGGTVHFVPDFEMSQTGKDNEIFIADTSYLSYMYLEGQDIHIDKGKAGVGLQLTDETKTKHQILGSVGMKRTFKDSHFHLFNLL